MTTGYFHVEGKGARRLFRRRGSVLDSTSNWIHYRFISRQRTSKSVLARQSSSSLVSGEWEYWNADFTTRELCMYALNRRIRERSSYELDIGRVGVLECGFHYKENTAFTSSFARCSHTTVHEGTPCITCTVPAPRMNVQLN